MPSRVRWTIAALIVLIFPAVVWVPLSRAQVARISKGTSGPTALSLHVASFKLASCTASTLPAIRALVSAGQATGRVAAGAAAGDSRHPDTLSATTPATPGNPVCQFSNAFVGPYSNAGSIVFEAMAVDGQGNNIIAGVFSGQVNFGGGILVSHGGNDIFIAKYFSGGVHLWSRNMGGAGNDWAKAVAVDSTGSIFITSWSASGSVDFGGGPIPIAFGYLAKFSSDGTYQWAHSLCSNVSDGTAIQTDSNGDVIISGSFTGPCNFGGGPIASIARDVFLARYSSAGNFLWAIRIGGSTGTAISQVVVDHSGDIVITGYTTGPGDTGGVSFLGFGKTDIFLAKYSAAGLLRWSRLFGGVDSDMGKSVAIDSQNNIVMTGSIGATIFGSNIFLNKYSSLGNPLWSKNFPLMLGSSENGNRVTIDSADNILITGALIGDVDFGGGVLPATPGDGNNNTYVAEYTSTGTHLWSMRFANLIPANSPGVNTGKAIGTDSGGNAIIFGSFADSVDFGCGRLTNPGACGGACGYGGYLVKFGPPATTPTSTPTQPAITPSNTPTPTRTTTPAFTSTATPMNTATKTPTNTLTQAATSTPTQTPTKGPKPPKPTRTPRL